MDEHCILDPQRDCLGLQKANMLEAQMKEWREAARATHKDLLQDSQWDNPYNGYLLGHANRRCRNHIVVTSFKGVDA